jgi:hypothetical protein
MALPHKLCCQVVGCLDKNGIHILWNDGSVVRIPVSAVPNELRFPNCVFWLSWDEDNFFVYENAEADKPIGTGPRIE